MKKKQKLNVKAFVSIGMLSSIAFLLMLLNFPLPLLPNFLLVDFSDIPVLIATLIFGPIAGVLVELLKNVLHYFLTGSATGVPVGQIANFIAGVVFILPTYYIYTKLNSRKGMTVGLIVGTLAMGIMMSILNYFVILPAYTFFLGFPAMSAPETRLIVVTGILPFNIIKGVIMSSIFMLLFIRMQVWLDKNTMVKSL